MQKLLRNLLLPILFTSTFCALKVTASPIILVNTYTEGWQGRPDIAMNNNGDIVITWDSYYRDYSLYDVFAQRFDEEMNKRGDEFQVNSPTEGRHVSNHTTMDREGNFVVAWSELLPVVQTNFVFL